MTPEKIEQMEASLEGATKGPWVARHLGTRSDMQRQRDFVFINEADHGSDDTAIARIINGERGRKRMLQDADLISLAPDMAAHIIAQNEQIAALENRVKAADELARECEWRGVSAFLGNISALVNAYRATGEQP